MIFHRTLKVPLGFSGDELCAFCDGFVDQVGLSIGADLISGQLIHIEGKLHYFGVFDSWEEDPDDPEEEGLPECLSDNVIQFPAQRFRRTG